MITKEDVIAKAMELAFEDIGFTTAEPFDEHEKALDIRRDEYHWMEEKGYPLLEGCNPKSILPDAKAIIVLMENYFRRAYPRIMEGHFGRCYLDDDRVTRDGLFVRTKAFRAYLRENGIESKVPFHLPHRSAAARAGMGTFGKNCLFYSRKAARKGSWVLPIAIVVDKAFSPDPPAGGIDCPDWCRSACVAACPTRALNGNGTLDPKKCISYLSYYGEGLTPIELREPMGIYVYGCDRCQNVCPRNAPWLAKKLPVNKKVEDMAEDFRLERLLFMDKQYFTEKIWPRMFYMPSDEIWRWQMNAARAMGNTHDEKYLDSLSNASRINPDERVRAMAAWAIGCIGGEQAKNILEDMKEKASGVVLDEIEAALDRIKNKASIQSSIS